MATLTAQEVLKMAQEVSDDFNKTYDRLKRELLRPLTERTFKVLQDAGHIKTPPTERGAG